MRVIGGRFRSRRLKTLPGRALRPTSDRMRETLFDVLGEELKGKVFVDAYAGSGAVGIEALSRGAARVVFIESDRKAVAVIWKNLRALGLEAQVVARPVLSALGGMAADIVFLDPPYEEKAEYERALRRLGEAPPPLVVAEHARRLELGEAYGGLRRVRVLQQGDSRLSFYRASPPGLVIEALATHRDNVERTEKMR
ncbi:MAG: 16S rRNA (guanine(966)-N(2))-methyltransferase RsmD [Acidobacteria bacterium]|nr:16S rRNA (guanine(966)-N(2))-methyltransferase RsmD [Acidobacteriota bacterium]